MRRATVSLIDAVQVAAIALVALVLVPAGAHLFELPNKIGLPAEQYMIVQDIYRGWALFGFVIAAALGVLLWHTYLVRDETPALTLSLVAFFCVIGTQLVFWTWTYPMNALTSNWTVMPSDLDAARRQWEYSHAASAVLSFAALIAISLSVIASRPREGCVEAGTRSG